MEQLYPTRKLTWPEAAKLAQKRVEEILHKEVPCQIVYFAPLSPRKR